MAYGVYDLLVRTRMRSATGLPADDVVNDFAFAPPDVLLDAAVTQLVGRVSDFFRTIQTSGYSVSSFISNAINRGATHEIEVFHIVDGPMGSPIHTQAWLGPTASQNTKGMPTECAGVLSFHADLGGIVEEIGTTRPKARRRGRLFIGPIGDLAINADGPAPYYLSDVFQTTARQAAVALMDASNAAGTPWSVWSRKDKVLRPVVGGWTDNAPDTQRRRGPKASSRTLWGSTVLG